MGRIKSNFSFDFSRTFLEAAELEITRLKKYFFVSFAKKNRFEYVSYAHSFASLKEIFKYRLSLSDKFLRFPLKTRNLEFRNFVQTARQITQKHAYLHGR